jgi:hypothetical protein
MKRSELTELHYITPYSKYCIHHAARNLIA